MGLLIRLASLKSRATELLIWSLWCLCVSTRPCTVCGFFRQKYKESVFGRNVFFLLGLPFFEGNAKRFWTQKGEISYIVYYSVLISWGKILGLTLLGIKINISLHRTKNIQK